MKDTRSEASDWNAMWKSVESALKGQDTYLQDRVIGALRNRLRTSEPMPLVTALRVLQLLKQCRRFFELTEIADLIRAFESEWPSIRKTAAQGLIETGQIDRAIRELETTRGYILDALARTESTIEDAQVRLELRPELAEIEGLLGRAHKQRCVDHRSEGPTEGRREDARKSLSFYWDAYRAAPVQNLWHGINYVAVALYATRNLQVAPPGEPPNEVAREILRTLEYLESQKPLDEWGEATRGEAALALDNLDLAVQSYNAYLARDLRDFNRGSSRRQLEEIWELPSTHTLMNLFARAGAGRLIVPAVSNPEPLEARIEDAPYSLIGNNPKAAERAVIVARLGRKANVGSGTGFLFNGARISPKYRSKALLLTCAHVCSCSDPDAVRPNELNITFFQPDGDMNVEFAEQLWSSPREELDATLLLIKGGPIPLPRAPLARRKIRKGDQANVIGHPLGGAKLASLVETAVLDIDAEGNRFYYRSATDPGSSGSPVFNDEWEITGIHRSGPHVKPTNHGTRIDVVVAALKAHFDTAK